MFMVCVCKYVRLSSIEQPFLHGEREINYDCMKDCSLINDL